LLFFVIIVISVSFIDADPLIALQIHPFLFKMVEIVEGVGLGYVL
jgi:hypothetical protein